MDYCIHVKRKKVCNMNTENTRTYLIHFKEIDPDTLTPQQLYESLKEDFTELAVLDQK